MDHNDYWDFLTKLQIADLYFHRHEIREAMAQQASWIMQDVLTAVKEETLPRYYKKIPLKSRFWFKRWAGAHRDASLLLGIVPFYFLFSYMMTYMMYVSQEPPGIIGWLTKIVLLFADFLLIFAIWAT